VRDDRGHLNKTILLEHAVKCMMEGKNHVCRFLFFMKTKALERQRNRQDLNRYIEISIFEKVSIEGVVWCAARLYGYLGSSLAVSGRSEHMHEHEQPVHKMLSTVLSTQLLRMPATGG